MSNKIKPLYASHDQLLTCDRLMKWTFQTQLPASFLDSYHNLVLEQIALKLTQNLDSCPYTERRLVFGNQALQHGLIYGLLPSIFWGESIYSLWGRVIVQHLGITINSIEKPFKLCPLPALLLPTTCVSCGKPLKGLNRDNFLWLNKWKCSESDSSTYRDCETDWSELKKTFELAFNALCAIPNQTPVTNGSRLKENLDVILGAYHLLAQYIDGFYSGERPFFPRYGLVEEYSAIDFTPYFKFLMFSEGLPVIEPIPMFRDDLKGKIIATIENENGQPINSQGDLLTEENVIKISDLKDYFINPSKTTALTT